MKKGMILLLTMLSVTLCSCGQGVLQEDYDRVVAERDEYLSEIEEYVSESEKLAKEFFADVESVAVSESIGGTRKILNIICYTKIYSDNEEVAALATEIGKTLGEIQEQEWFDFDYVMLDFWSESLGRILSITVNANDLSKPMQMHGWYGEKDSAQDNNQGESIENSDERIVYQDENIIISYTGITGKESNYDVNFIIENLSDKTLIIQVRETSINGFMVDPMCSIEIAPGKKAMDKMTIWSDDAKNHPMSTVENIETKFHIFNNDDRYDTESIKIVGN